MRSRSGSSASARFWGILAVVVVILVIHGCAGTNGAGQGRVTDQDLKAWPKASSPPSYLGPNGDRIGGFPPYFYPSR